MEGTNLFPDYIISENGDKFVPNNGNLLFLMSVIYCANNFPVRLLINEGKEMLTCAFVVYISKDYFVCIDTSSVGANFQSVFKIPVNTFESLKFGDCDYKIYVKETCTK